MYSTSLCPLSCITYLCGGLGVSILFAATDKGTRTITSDIWFCYISMFGLKNRTELDARLFIFLFFFL